MIACEDFLLNYNIYIYFPNWGMVQGQAETRSFVFLLLLIADFEMSEVINI